MTAQEKTVKTSLATTHQKLVALSHDVVGFDLRSLEVDETRDEALRACVELAQRAVATFEELVEPVDTTGPPSSRIPILESTRADEAGDSTFDEYDPLRQVTYLARMEITRVLERISASTIRTPEYVVPQGASLYRKVWRGVGVVEEALAKLLEIEPEAAVVSNLTASLRVRKIYAWFRRSIDADVHPRKETIQKALRKVGTRIAALIGKDEYSDLRPDDRVLFGRLQARILEWLRLDHPSFEEGRRLWEDCRAMGDILRQVNLRADLIAHDARLARALQEELNAYGETEQVSPQLFQRLLSLEGLDDELDLSFAERQAPLRRTVDRVLNRADSAARSRGL